MTPDERDRLKALEVRFEGISKDLDQMSADVRAIRELLDQTRGGWKVLVAASGFSGVVGAAIMKVAPWLAALK